MRLEGWHVMVLSSTVVMAAAVVVAGTLLVMWTVRRARKRNTEDGPAGNP